MRACTCTVAPPGCRDSVVTSLEPSPGMARCSNAVTWAPGSTDVAAVFTNSERMSDTDAGLDVADVAAPKAPGFHSQTCLPSGSDTWVPGMRVDPSALKCAGSQCGLRLNSVAGIGA
ncbi:Uncharacterised protein [Mycobacteroides abscessus]|nr:Uncharacterised protein [Mycobacteroides abscessus]